MGVSRIHTKLFASFRTHRPCFGAVVALPAFICPVVLSHSILPSLFFPSLQSPTPHRIMLLFEHIPTLLAHVHARAAQADQRNSRGLGDAK
jgi:hypothetical protein